jgi:hypothetical protein
MTDKEKIDAITKDKEKMLMFAYLILKRPGLLPYGDARAAYIIF